MPITSSGQIALIADIEAEFDQTGTTDISMQQARDDAGLSGEIQMTDFYGLSDALPSSVSTGGVNTGTTTASVLGTVTDDGGATVTERGFYFGTSSTFSNNTKFSVGSGTGQFTKNFTGLSSGTTYYSTAYAINSTGETRGGTANGTTSLPNLSSIYSCSCPSPSTRNVGAQYSSNQTSFISSTISAGSAPSGGISFGVGSFGSGISHSQFTFNYVFPSNGYGASNPQTIGAGVSINNGSVGCSLSYGQGTRQIGAQATCTKSGYTSFSFTTHIFNVS
jgi:hypothetical protein